MSPSCPPESSTPDPDDEPRLGAEDEQAWMTVVQKMDETYEELLEQQVTLEEKNAALEEAQRFIESVLGAMSDLLLVCDVAGRIQRANAALERLVGRDAAELEGCSFQTLFAASEHDRLQEFPQIIRNRAVTDCEARIVDADGGERPVTINCTSRYDPRGRLVGMVLIARDLGELHRAYRDLDQAHQELQQTQHRLVQSEKMASLGRLIAGVAHELNNPIAFIHGNVHVMRRYADRLRRYVEAVDAAGVDAGLRDLRAELRLDQVLADRDSVFDGTLEGTQRISDLVGELKQYSGGQRGEPEVFDLVALLRTAAQWVEKGRGQRGLVTLELPTELPVLGRSGQLHQVFVNLLENAADAAGEGSGEVAVRGRSTADGIAVTVADNGPGLDPEHIPELFEPFYTTKPPGQGTGLGLYIAYGIVHEHGGTLEASNAPAGGACFTVHLPLAPPAARTG